MKLFSNQDFDFIPPRLKVGAREDLNEISIATDALLDNLYREEGARRFIVSYDGTQLEKLYPSWAEKTGKFAAALSNIDDPVTIYELDELLGLQEHDPRRFAVGIERILDQAGHPKELRVLFNSHGEGKKIIAEYRKLLRQFGKPQVALLGVGPNGQVGYHEPGISPIRGIHSAILEESSRMQQEEIFGSLEKTPKTGVTWGVKNFKEMTSIVMASGSSKASPLGRIFDYSISVRDNPVSFIREMPEGRTAYLIADREALSQTPFSGMAFV